MAFVEKKRKLFVHSIKVGLNDQQSSTLSQPFFSKRQRTAYIFSTSQKNSNCKALLYKNPPGNGFILVWSRRDTWNDREERTMRFFDVLLIASAIGCVSLKWAVPPSLIKYCFPFEFNLSAKSNKWVSPKTQGQNSPSFMLN